MQDARSPISGHLLSGHVCAEIRSGFGTMGTLELSVARVPAVMLALGCEFVFVSLFVSVKCASKQTMSSSALSVSRPLFRAATA